MKATPVESGGHTEDERSLRNFSRLFMPLIFVVLTLVAAITIAVFVFIAAQPKADSWRTILAIHLVQIGDGMVLGLLCVFIGTMMCWFGVTGAYTVAAETGAGKLNIQGAQIGLVLLIGGVLLAGISLHKSITSTELTRSFPQEQAEIKDSGSGMEGTLKALIDQNKAVLEQIRTIAVAAPMDDTVGAVRRDNRTNSDKAALSELLAAESGAARQALQVAEESAKGLSDPKSREGAKSVVDALKDFADAKAAEIVNNRTKAQRQPNR